MTPDLWAFRPELRTEGVELREMAVQAADGGIGKVQDVVERGPRAFLLVDTGPWIFGKTIKVPAGLVRAVDAEQRIVLVDRPKDDIKNAPEQDDLVDDAEHEEALTRHYAGDRDDGSAVGAPSEPSEAVPTAAGDLASFGAGVAPGAASAPVEERGADREGAEAAPAAASLEPERSVAPGATGDVRDAGAPPTEGRAPDASGVDAPTPLSGLVTSEGPPAEQAPPAPSPQEAEEPAREEPRRPAAPRRRTPAAERSSDAPAPEPAEAPSRRRPTATDGKQAEAPSRRKPTATDGNQAEAPSRRRPTATDGKQAEAPSRRKPTATDGKQAEAPSRRKPTATDGKPAETPTRRRSTGTAAKRAKAPAAAESTPRTAKPQAQRAKGTRNDAPLPRYDSLTAAEVVGRLRALTQSELAKVERYEKGAEGRQTILKRVASLREKEPWRGYDSATVKEVRERLAGAKADRVTAVRDYERRHRNRTGVMDAARRRLESM